MRFIVLFILVGLLSGCGYNEIQIKDEAVKASWAQVLNVYKRRDDLIPNLVATVKGYAQQEEKVLIGVTEARAKVGQIKVDPDSAESLQQFQQAQGELSGALSRLLVITENYPNLKSDQAFLNLQTQLEGTENRITVERGRYIQAVQDYNTLVRKFPVNLTAKMFGHAQKPSFTVEDERAIQDAPAVDFGGQANAAGPVMVPGQTQTIAPAAPPPGLAPTRSSDPGPQPIPVPQGQEFRPPPQPAPTGG